MGRLGAFSLSWESFMCCDFGNWALRLRKAGRAGSQHPSRAWKPCSCRRCPGWAQLIKWFQDVLSALWAVPWRPTPWVFSRSSLARAGLVPSPQPLLASVVPWSFLGHVDGLCVLFSAAGSPGHWRIFHVFHFNTGCLGSWPVKQIIHRFWKRRGWPSNWVNRELLLNTQMQKT